MLKHYRAIKCRTEQYQETNHTLLSADAQADYKKCKIALKILNDYIYSIDDETVKTITIQHYMYGDSYETISRKMHYSKSTIERKLKNYISRKELTE